MAFLRPRSHVWATSSAPADRAGSPSRRGAGTAVSTSTAATLAPRASSPANSSLRAALEWARCTECRRLPSPASRSSHFSRRGNIALPVAIVGSAKNTPPAPKRAAKTSATASAASVLPSPIGASMTISPGAVISRASAIALSWTGRTFALRGRANRDANSSCASPAGSVARHGAGRSSPCQAAASRSWLLCAPASGKYGKRAGLLAIQSQTMTSAVSSTWTGCGSFTACHAASRLPTPKHSPHASSNSRWTCRHTPLLRPGVRSNSSCPYRALI